MNNPNNVNEREGREVELELENLSLSGDKLGPNKKTPKRETTTDKHKNTTTTTKRSEEGKEAKVKVESSSSNNKNINNKSIATENKKDKSLKKKKHQPTTKTDRPQKTNPNNIQYSTTIDSTILESLRSYQLRKFVKRLNTDVMLFMKDDSVQRIEFAHMTSYQRLLLHRLADYFRLHHPFNSATGIISLIKIPPTHIPKKTITEYIAEYEAQLESKSLASSSSSSPSHTPTIASSNSDGKQSPMTDKKLKIMKRVGLSNTPDNSIENLDEKRKIQKEGHSDQSHNIEDREKAYEKTREQIFNDGTDKDGNEDFQEEQNEDVGSYPLWQQGSSNSSSSSSSSNSGKNNNNNRTRGGGAYYGNNSSRGRGNSNNMYRYHNTHYPVSNPNSMYRNDIYYNTNNDYHYYYMNNMNMHQQPLTPPPRPFQSQPHSHAHSPHIVHGSMEPLYYSYRRTPMVVMPPPPTHQSFIQSPHAPSTIPPPQPPSPGPQSQINQGHPNPNIQTFVPGRVGVNINYPFGGAASTGGGWLQ